MKRGQLMDQPFVMIFGIIVGALILVWGFAKIWDITNSAEEVATLKEVDKLKTTIEKYFYSEIGSQKTHQVKISNIDYFCFYNKSMPWNPGMTNNKDIKKEIPNYQIMNKQTNTFFTFPLERNSAFLIRYLYPETNNPLCFEKNSQIKIQTTDEGVKISKP